MSNFDISKPYGTRCGGTASVILAPDGFLYGWLADRGNQYGRGKWLIDGTFWPSTTGYCFPGVPHQADLVNVLEKRTVKIWINIHVYLGYQVFKSREDADSYAGAGRIACIERDITYTVGEGLVP